MILAIRLRPGLFLWVIATMLCPACSGKNASSLHPPHGGRNSAEAQRHNTRGLQAVEKKDFAEAEQHFRAAIAQDLYYAPAHNNLGLALLEQKRYYEAAWEFDQAAKLAPESPDPRTNLGLLYEKIGRLDQATEEYDAALTIDPGNVATMQHLARAYVKNDRRDDRLRAILERILLQPPDNPQWDVWARGQLVRLGRPPESAPVPIPGEPE